MPQTSPLIGFAVACALIGVGLTPSGVGFAQSMPPMPGGTTFFAEQVPSDAACAALCARRSGCAEGVFTPSRTGRQGLCELKRFAPSLAGSGFGLAAGTWQRPEVTRPAPPNAPRPFIRPQPAAQTVAPQASRPVQVAPVQVAPVQAAPALTRPTPTPSVSVTPSPLSPMMGATVPPASTPPAARPVETPTVAPLKAPWEQGNLPGKADVPRFSVQRGIEAATPGGKAASTPPPPPIEIRPGELAGGQD